MSNSVVSTKKDKVLAILKELDTQGNIKNSAIEGVKTAVVSLAGAGLGKLAGRPSLLVGLGATMVGHYMKSNRLTYFGVGVMAGGLTSAGSLQGPEQPIKEKMKERLKSFGSDLKHRLYLDKFVKPKKTEGTNGLGEVQYFKYPSNELNMGGLDAIEDEIIRHTEGMAKRQMAGHDEDVSGTYEDVSGTEDPIY